MTSTQDNISRWRIRLQRTFAVLAEKLRRYLLERLDSIEHSAVTRNILNALPFWVGAILTGIVSIFYAKMFGWAEDLSKYLFQSNSYTFLIISPVLFVAAWLLVTRYARFARGSGIPQVTAAIELSTPKTQHRMSRLLSIRVIVVKIMSSLLMVIGGGAIGREGPTIQISASIFKKINDLLPAWYPKISRKNMIITGAASGLASAFNTPLGGIVFAIEELTKTHLNFFKSALLTGVIIAGLTALNFLGPYLYIGYPDTGNVGSWVIFAVIPVAVLAGLTGTGMGKIILLLLKFKRRLRKNYLLLIYAALAGLTIALLAIFVDAGVMGSGREIMTHTLFTADKHEAWYIPILRVIGPIISFSSGAAGGIFAPALSAGASIGSWLSGVIGLTDTESNLMILCGMVALLTGITRSPFTSSILVLEMTNDHNIIFHLMFTALTANLVANIISRKSFYDSLKEQYLDELQKKPVVKKEV